jgi:hypothetical protein
VARAAERARPGRLDHRRLTLLGSQHRRRVFMIQHRCMCTGNHLQGSPFCLKEVAHRTCPGFKKRSRCTQKNASAINAAEPLSMRWTEFSRCLQDREGKKCRRPRKGRVILPADHARLKRIEARALCSAVLDSAFLQLHSQRICDRQIELRRHRL